jgi:hypothetical protein
MMAKVSDETLAKANPERRTYVLTRSGNVGTFKYACSTWSGDNATRCAQEHLFLKELLLNPSQLEQSAWFPADAAQRRYVPHAGLRLRRRRFRRSPSRPGAVCPLGPARCHALEVLHPLVQAQQGRPEWCRGDQLALDGESYGTASADGCSTPRSCLSFERRSSGATSSSPFCGSG